MKASKQKKLEAAGWKVGSASEVLELSEAEAMLVNMKLALAKKIKVQRTSKRNTQNNSARLSSARQTRVERREGPDRT